MVSQATIQAKVDKGFAKGAAALGVPCAWYRPSGPNNPLDPANLQGTLPVLIDTAASLNQAEPRRREKPEGWYAAFDRSLGVQVGDYLVTPASDTFFITTLDPFRTSRLAACNRVIDIFAPGTMPRVGFNPGYGGDVRARETPVISGWPATLIKGPRGDVGDVKLPGDTKLPWEELVLPPIPATTLRNDMIVTYSDGTDTFRLVLSLVELTSLGYRCTAIYETT